MEHITAPLARVLAELHAKADERGKRELEIIVENLRKQIGSEQNANQSGCVGVRNVQRNSQTGTTRKNKNGR